MKRFLVILIFAFIISGGTVGILYQEGFGGVKKAGGDTEVTAETNSDAIDGLATEDDLSSAAAEETDIASSYAETEEDTSFDNIGDSSVSESADEATYDDSALTEDSDSSASTEPEAAVEETADTEDESAKTEEADEEALAKKKAEKEEKGPFYSVKVLGINGGGLTLHKNSSGQGDTIATISKNTTGYMIGSEAAGTRRLCYVDGKIGYLSKNYTEVTEISADEYPDALLSVTEDDSGKEISLD